MEKLDTKEIMKQDFIAHKEGKKFELECEVEWKYMNGYPVPCKVDTFESFSFLIGKKGILTFKEEA
jgi:hypothetical protein